MYRTLWGGLAGLSLLACSAPAFGKRMPPVPLPLRVAAAEMVIVGKVTAIEDKTAKADPFSGAKQKAPYKVAVVKVEEVLLGAKGLTHVRVGFIPLVDGPYRLYSRGELAKGQEACLLLTPHPTANFHEISFDGVRGRQQIAEVRKVTRMLADPIAALKAKSAAARAVAAAVLLEHYRTRRRGDQQEPISAEESKLILQAIAGADWGTVLGRDPRLSPQASFRLLGLRPADGWKPVRFQQLEPAAKRWLKNNADKYRIKRYGVEPKK